MAGNQLQFDVPEGMAEGDLHDGLLKEIGLVDAVTGASRRIFYDSFDWRLYATGGVLEYVTSGGAAAKLVWRSLSGAIRATQEVEGAPRFAQDLPAGVLRDSLAGILEMRALLPQAGLRTGTRTMKLLDAEEKTVLRLAVEKNTVQGINRGKSGRLGLRVRLLPVRGYRGAVTRAAGLLKKIGLVPAKEDILLHALRAGGREPAAYSTSLNLHLQPEMRADEASRAILLRLLDIMQDNEQGVSEDLDSEFLHDFRVAVRKTRSALAQIKGVIPGRTLQRYRKDFAWLGAMTTPTRDMDVYLLNFDRYRAALPKAIQADLCPLLDFLQAHRKAEQKALVRVLRSARYRRLADGWRTFLKDPVAVRSTLPNATRSVIELADERIMHVYRKAMKEGRAIGPDSPAADLHELRKTCKKLRYLMEFFSSLYPASKTGRLISALKMLQDNLGDFQDFEVQASTLRGFSQEMMDEGRVPPQTMMAMGVLIEGLEARQRKAHAAFAKTFARFSTPANEKHFRALFEIRAG